MKAKKLIAALAAVTLSVSMLAGCGVPTTKKINLAEYCSPVAENSYYSKAMLYGTAAQVDTDGSSISVNVISAHNTAIAICGKDDKKYGYDVATGSKVFDGNSYDSITYNSSSGVWRCTNNPESPEETGVYTTLFGDDGNTRLLESAKYSTADVTTENVYIDGKTVSQSVVKITYAPEGAAENAEPSVKYFTHEASDAKSQPVYAEVSENNISRTSPFLAVGSIMNTVPRSVHTRLGAGYDDPALSNYSYSTITAYSQELIDSTVNADRVTYTFYNGTSKSGEVKIENGWFAGFVGKYMYYVEVESRAFDAKNGFNLVVQTGEYPSMSAKKYNVTCYRYDFTKDKVKKVDPGYLPLRLQAFYNNTKHTYDAALVGGIAKTDGKYLYTTTNDLVSYVTDTELKVAQDLTATPYKTVAGATLTGNRRLIRMDNGYGVVNEKFETVASFYSFSEITDSYIVCRPTSGSKNSVIDFNGRILLEGADTVQIAGNYAITTEGGETFVKDLTSGSDPTPVSEVISSVSADDTVSVLSGGIICVYSKHSEDNYYSLRAFNASGNALFSCDNVNSTTGYVTSYRAGDKLFVTISAMVLPTEGSGLATSHTYAYTLS